MGNFLILFSLHKLEIHELRTPFNISNIAEDALEMFIDAFQVSLRWLNVRAGMNFEYPSWRLGMGKELDIFASVISISEPLIFNSIQEGTPTTFFGRHSLITSIRNL